MLGRQVGGSLLRLPIRSRLALPSTTPFQGPCPPELTSRAAVFTPLRSYATPGRPRKAVGEPSRPVKRAAKKQARSTSKDDSASETVAARKKKSTTSAKPKAKKKAGPKVLTEEQKARRAQNQEKQKIRDLKAQALKPPTSAKALSAFNMFVKEKTKPGTERAADQMKVVAQEWKNVTPAEQEHYNHLAVVATEAAHAELKKWVESHSADEIRRANNARHQLARKLPSKTGRANSKWKTIPDERQPKSPLGSYILFAKNRQQSGDFKNISIQERGRLIGKEWRALSDGEKAKYKDLGNEERSRYAEEHKDAFGHMPHADAGLQSASAAA